MLAYTSHVQKSKTITAFMAVFGHDVYTDTGEKQ